MTLNQAIKETWYAVESILSGSGDEDLNSRFYKLGFFPGTKVMLKRKAPLFGDPLLFQVEGSQIALTKAEATLVKIKEIG
jgi:Fe2+ transport system protein FeoA